VWYVVCTWDGNKRFGALSTTSKRCRCVFSNEMEYRGHMLHAHTWYCPSCETRNTGLSFPKCEMCSNVLSEDGENAADVMIKHAIKIDRCLDKFLKRDLAHEIPDYNLRDRLIQVNVLMRDDKEDARRLAEELAAAEAKSSSGSSVCSLVSNDKVLSRFPIIVKKEHLALEALKKKASPKKKKKKKGEDAVRDPKKNYRDENLERSLEIDLSDKINNSIGIAIPSITPMLKKRISEMPPMTKSEDPILYGIINPVDFDEIIGDETYAVEVPEVEDEYESSLDFSVDYTANNSALSIERMMMEMTGQESVGNRLQVCKGFLDGKCTLTTCPKAHPHVRDKAKLTWLKFTGMLKRVPFVDVCTDWVNQCCEHGDECANYHTYIRPSTAELIKKIYPIKAGKRRQVFKSGAVAEGNAKNDQMHGYATMTWTSGAVYMGDWIRGKRDGFGIFRSEKGVEYIGQWRGGKKEGWGQLTHPNGEEYVGQWFDGEKPEVIYSWGFVRRAWLMV
jgi:hypothetical protein